MREWGLTAEAPLPLRIAADARLTVPSYVDDQIWELNLMDGLLAIETSYGRRALGMRVFPGFRLGQETWINPAEFHSPPSVNSFLPNYIRTSFQPADKLHVLAEFWAKESNLLGGRYRLYNAGSEVLRPELLIHAQLQPDQGAEPMTSRTEQGAIVLQGSTGNLAPVIFLSGGPRAAISPYPALSVRARLDPGASELFVWAHAACGDIQESFNLARELIATKWDAEIARVEQANVGLVDIETGDPEVDLALTLAQTSSVAAFVGPTRHLPHASIVQERMPDRGYSSHPDGRDHGPGWDGVSLSDAYVTINQILPCAPELAKGILLNFLATQAPDGMIDWNAGLGGQLSGVQAVPLLATLVWRIYQHTEDREFLGEVYPRLLRFMDIWFDESHDVDRDGFPEWRSTTQAGFEEWQAFYRYQRWAQGADITLAETPDLASYLYREIRALTEIAKLLGHSEEYQDLSSRQMLLQEVIERTWDEKQNSYLAQDRDHNLTVSGSRLAQEKGEFEFAVDRKFDPPIRVLFRIQGEEVERQGLRVTIRGQASSGRKRVHEWAGREFQWVEQFGTLTSNTSFRSINKIELRGLSPDARSEVRIADYSRPDHTGLLPLWAGVPKKERANQLVKHTIVNERRYWREYGVPGWPADGLAYRHARVQMRPNLMIGEGLIEYGYLSEAARLVDRLLAASIHSLRENRTFAEFYRPDEAGGDGILGHSSGVAPFSLFLDVLGVRLISSRKVALRGFNPFKRPIQLRYRGFEIRWNGDDARIVFPDGAETVVTGKQVHLVEETDI